MRELVGDEEAEALRDIQNMIKQLEEDGLVKRSGNDYELTARGIRRIGQKMLEDIFDQLDKDAFGQHRLPERGYGGERTDDTKPYIFGDAFHLQLERTLMNGVTRNGPGTPVRLVQDDFEVYRTEQMTQSATVMMLDMSYSMQLNDLWQPAKKVAIALESLIRGQFPRDQLYIVGFAYLARQYQARGADRSYRVGLRAGHQYGLRVADGETVTGGVASSEQADHYDYGRRPHSGRGER